MAKCVVITGGSRGIGKACVEKFAANGFNVIFSYLKEEEKALKLEQSLVEKGYENFFDMIFGIADTDISSLAGYGTI